MASTDLRRTPSSNGSGTTCTWSMWVKRSSVPSPNQQSLFSAGSSGNALFDVYFFNNMFQLEFYNGSTNYFLRSSNLFRDTSAWYHIVAVWDTTNGTSTDRIRMYVNGERITNFDNSGYPTLNYSATYLNNTSYVNYVGSKIGGSFFDGSMAHFHFIDGTAYDADTFGETDATTGIWKPITAPSVTYGTNGFFLKFENSGSMGTDSSGNSNNFTVNGTMTQTIDTPSNVFATMNPITGNTNPTFSNGNCSVQGTSAGNVPATIGVSSGKWYWEQKVTSSNAYVAICNDSGYNATVSVSGSGSGAVGYFGSGEIFDEGGSAISSLTTFTTNDIIGVHLNMDDGNITWYKNGSIVSGSTYTFGTTGNGTLFETAFPCFNVGGATTRSSDFNFGNGYFGTTAVSSAQNPDDGIGIFEYAVPTGYKALCTKSINAQEYD